MSAQMAAFALCRGLRQWQIAKRNPRQTLARANLSQDEGTEYLAGKKWEISGANKPSSIAKDATQAAIRLLERGMTSRSLSLRHLCVSGFPSTTRERRTRPNR